MDLGAFSISLAVKDLEASRTFYEKFGFKVCAGDASQSWLIMKIGNHAIVRGRPASSPRTRMGIRSWSISTCEQETAQCWADGAR